ncbi:MAG: hypothetical protein KBG28_26575 [Kofleriaceae bacterium]|jgi:hypothetical protein|nr:hypothetical protein [Kofleriaceae bacterium]MBP6841383.1 hypothetical protein [Kofleriaceae bacterium]MBP9207558.1 hypothetical protein [Kofleriaceae bacterium]
MPRRRLVLVTLIAATALLGPRAPIAAAQPADQDPADPAAVVLPAPRLQLAVGGLIGHEQLGLAALTVDGNVALGARWTAHVGAVVGNGYNIELTGRPYWAGAVGPEYVLCMPGYCGGLGVDVGARRLERAATGDDLDNGLPMTTVANAMVVTPRATGAVGGEHVKLRAAVGLPVAIGDAGGLGVELSLGAAVAF